MWVTTKLVQMDSNNNVATLEEFLMYLLWFGYSYLFHTRVWQALVPFLLLTLMIAWVYTGNYVNNCAPTPSNDPTTVYWCQVMVNVRLVERQVSICSDTNIYPLVVTYPKLWWKKACLFYSAKVPSLNKLISYENSRNCLGQKTPKISNCVREFRFSKSVKIW